MAVTVAVDATVALPSRKIPPLGMIDDRMRAVNPSGPQTFSGQISQVPVVSQE